MLVFGIEAFFFAVGNVHNHCFIGKYILNQRFGCVLF